jgi:molybdate transport system regulatory protein
MKRNSKSTNSLSVHLRLQIVSGEKIALGPGKVELLTLLAETGSIRDAAKRMKMSYMKAWSLIQTMNPLVLASRGGQNRGGVELTEAGCEALALYRKMERDSLCACEGSWAKFQSLFRS